jgi:hypothetical protein
MALNAMENSEAMAFHARLKGTFHGILQWQQLDALWERVKSGHWFFYQLGEAVPENALHGSELAERVDALNALLHNEHEYDYCGIVYADQVEIPTLIKVYDPNNLGSACSHSTTPTPLRWILSTAQPPLIENHDPAPNSRKRWWQLFSR